MWVGSTKENNNWKPCFLDLIPSHVAIIEALSHAVDYSKIMTLPTRQHYSALQYHALRIWPKCPNLTYNRFTVQVINILLFTLVQLGYLKIELFLILSTNYCPTFFHRKPRIGVYKGVHSAPFGTLIYEGFPHLTELFANYRSSQVFWPPNTLIPR